MPLGPLSQCSVLFAKKQIRNKVSVVTVAQMTNTFTSSGSIPITQRARLIGDVLPQSTSEKDQLSLLAKQQQIDQESVDEYRQLFNDNCVILERGSDIWYFLDPLNSIAEIKNIRLRHEDAIVSMPFDRTVFHSDRPNNDSEIFIFGIASEGPQKLIRKSKTSENNLSSLATDPSIKRNSVIWTATIVTRKLGQSLHHLVLGGGKDFSTAPLATGAAARFQSGDLIELTNLSIFAQRF